MPRPESPGLSGGSPTDIAFWRKAVEQLPFRRHETAVVNDPVLHRAMLERGFDGSVFVEDLVSHMGQYEWAVLYEPSEEEERAAKRKSKFAFHFSSSPKNNKGAFVSDGKSRSRNRGMRSA